MTFIYFMRAERFKTGQVMDIVRGTIDSDITCVCVVNLFSLVCAQNKRLQIIYKYDMRRRVLTASYLF